jgi:uncharacterized delta-60 repeat protein
MTIDDAAASPDAATSPDAFVGVPDAGRDGGMELFDARGPDAFVVADAFSSPDAFEATDAFVASDAGPILPPITDPTPHLVPASADGHDRLFGVTFAPDSSFYVVGVRAAGTATTDDWETIVGHFTPSGDLDTAFGASGWFVRNLAVGTNGEASRGIALQSDGKIVVVGTAEAVGAADMRDRDVYVLRLNTNGTLDETFGSMGVRVLNLSTGQVDGTGFSADASWNVVVDAMDRPLLSVAMVRPGGTDTDFGVARLTPNGMLDTTFASDGVSELDIENRSASPREVSVLGDGSIVLGGYYRGSGGILPLIYRLDSTGAPITTFGTGGVFNQMILTAQLEVYSVSVQGEYFVTCGYGRELGPDDNDLTSLRVNMMTGTRDLTYGTSGVGTIPGYDFNDNYRAHRILRDGRNVFAGAHRTSATTADAALVVLTRDGLSDTSYGTGGAMLANLADGTVDHFWGLAIDPTGTRMAAVGIGGTTPATDDDALVYLAPTP